MPIHKLPEIYSYCINLYLIAQQARLSTLNANIKGTKSGFLISIKYFFWVVHMINNKI